MFILHKAPQLKQPILSIVISGVIIDVPFKNTQFELQCFMIPRIVYFCPYHLFALRSRVSGLQVTR